MSAMGMQGARGERPSWVVPGVCVRTLGAGDQRSGGDNADGNLTDTERCSAEASGPGEHRLLQLLHPLASPAQEPDLPQLVEDRTGGCMDELVAEGQLQH